MKKRFLSLFLALALGMGVCAVPACAASAASSLSYDFSSLNIYDVKDGTYKLGTTKADVTVLIVGRVTCGNSTGTLRNVASLVKTLNVQNGRVYLLDYDQSEETVRSFAQRNTDDVHIAWKNDLQTYKNLFWQIVRAAEPGAASVTLPALVVLDRELKPVYCSTHDTYNSTALVSTLMAYAGSSRPTEPDDEPGQTVDADTQRIYDAMVALKARYPDGTPWTNDNYYAWKGGIFSGGYGCAGFAFMLSDAAFGSLPARKVTNFEYSDIRVGDILRLNNDTHSVIVLEVHDKYVTLAEGNYNRSVRWGRQVSASAALSADYLLTRYPETAATPAPAPTPNVSFNDVESWCSDAVNWAVSKEVTNGVTTERFGTRSTCTNAMILTFLWRAAGKPNSSAALPVDITGKNLAYAETALRWAAEKRIISSRNFDPTAPCTRLSAVTYIWKAMEPGVYVSGANFSDIAGKVDSMGEYAVSWAYMNGITDGVGNNKFSPNTVCTRGQIVTFLHRAYVPSARLW